jgi:hypothetical protein
VKRHAFIIGAQRSGTTYLAKLLQQHGDIEFAQPIFPEPKFFSDDSKYSLGIDHYQNTYFSTSSSSQLRIDKSTSYIESEVAAERIRTHFPDAPIIVVLRNPIHRAISNYFFTKKHGLELLDLEEALHNEDDRLDSVRLNGISVSPFAYKTRGKYVNYLQVWRRYFPSGNLYLVFFEEITKSIEPIKNLLLQMGLSPEIPSSLQAENSGAYPEGFVISERLAQDLQEEFLPSVEALDHEFGTQAKRLWGFANE